MGTMLKYIYQTLTSKYYWIVLLVIGISLELTALFYQYVLEYFPCVLCIHVRLIIVGVIFISMLALYFHENIRVTLTAHCVTTILFASLLERSYQLLGVERGFVSGDCSMNSGLPSWFAVDQWIPWLFKIWEPCGYTPELLFGITMAEALIVLSPILFLTSLFLTINLIKLK